MHEAAGTRTNTAKLVRRVVGRKTLPARRGTNSQRKGERHQPPLYHKLTTRRRRQTSIGGLPCVVPICLFLLLIGVCDISKIRLVYKENSDRSTKSHSILVQPSSSARQTHPCPSLQITLKISHPMSRSAANALSYIFQCHDALSTGYSDWRPYI
jgi:hypothetical protein